MYTTHLIYIEHKNRLDVYGREDITPVDLWSMVDMNTHVYVAVTKNNVSHALDYNRMLVDYEDAAVASTWEDYDSVLTDGLVYGYEVHLPAYTVGTVIPTNPVKVWDALSTLNTFNLDYGDFISSKYNIFAYRWMLHDLRMSIQEDCVTETPNLSRCLPIVNGFVCRPAYNHSDSALYALGGAKLCWFDYGRITPEVQLLDFTKVGKFDVVSIRDSENHTNNDVLFINKNTKWYFKFDNYNLSEYTPILVLGGILILPDQYIISNQNTISVNIDTIPFSKALPLKKMLQDESVSSAFIVYEGMQYKEYLKQQFTEELSSDCFMIFVHTKRLFINRQLNLDTWKNYNTVNDFNKNSYLLINKATSTIRNFHLDMLDDRNELIVQNHVVANLALDEDNHPSYVIVHSDCKHHAFQDINKSVCDGLKILGDINE
jgi:hypothetical protein